MSQPNHGLVSGTGKCRSICRKCNKRIRAQRRAGHVLHHVSVETTCNVYSCLECRFKTHQLGRIEQHVRHHIRNEEMKNDEMEIKQLYSEEWKKHRQIIDEMSISCFDCLFRVVKKKETRESRRVPSSSQRNAVPRTTRSVETTPDRAMLLPTVKDEISFEEHHLDLNSGIMMDEISKRIVKTEDVDVCYLNDDDNQKEEKQEETRSLLSASSTSVNQDVFNNYRLLKEWDTEELIANMRIVGNMLKFSKNNIDIAMDVLRENGMDGASMFYEDEDLSGFFKQCPVIYGVKTMIIKTLQAMRGG